MSEDRAVKTIRRMQGIVAGALFLYSGIANAATNPQAYGEAMTEYNAKEYAKAYSEFKKLFFDNMADPKVNFYLGRSAYESGNYNDALAAYERVLITQPEHMKARVELARTYFVMRMYEQAEIEFTTVLLHPIPEGVRKTINEYIKKIEDAREKHMLNAMFTLIAQDDSNINNGNNYSDVFTNPPVSDRSLSAYLALIHTYKLAERDTFWITKANVYTQKYGDYNDYDVTYPFVETGWQMKKKDYAFSILGGVEALEFGGESRYSGKSIAAQYDKQLAKTELLSSKLKITDKEYVKITDDGRDSRTIELDVKWQQIRPDGNIYSLFGNYAMEREKEDIRPGNDVDVDYTKLGGGYYTKISAQNALSLNYNLKLRKHVDENPFLGSARSDISHTVSASLITTIDKRSYLSFFANYTDNKSNQDLFSYSKTVAGVSYSINLDNDWLRNHPDWEGKK